eukprot:scaffold22549_cov98-Cylindrotheca_fusiformis.AAC.4
MALHQNPAAIIADKLNLDKMISPKVLQETQSALRILKLKSPSGTFGRQDNDLKRACALLEYVVREREGYKIPMDRLARAACMKERDFIKFHEIIGNFRRNSVASLRKNKTPANQIRQTSSIPSLAIKLGTYVQDSNGVSLRATKLYQELVTHARTMLASERINQLRDINDHRKAYEAACFYLAATNGKITKTRTTTMGQNEDDDSKRLQVSNIMDVSNEFTLAEFKNILHHAQTLCQEMKDGEKSRGQQRRAKKRPKDDGGSRELSNDVAARKTAAKRARSMGLLSEELASNATLNLLSRANDAQTEDEEVLQYEEARNKMQEREFTEWKRATVAFAIEKMKALEDEEGNEQTVSDEQALDRAVDEALQGELIQY